MVIRGSLLRLANFSRRVASLVRPNDSARRAAAAIWQVVSGTTLDDRWGIVGEGDAVTHPGYTGNGDGAGDIFDYGVVLFDEAVVLPTAELPSKNKIQQLVKSGDLSLSSTVSAVGYGLESAIGLGQGGYEPSDERKLATTHYNARTQDFLKISGIDGTACFGDSGGPAFLDIDGVETLIGVNVIADGSCAELVLTARTDIEDARAFLGQYVELP